MKPITGLLFDYLIAVPAATMVAGISMPLCIVDTQARREIYAANHRRAEGALAWAKALGQDVPVQTGTAAVLVVIGPLFLTGEVVLEVVDYVSMIYDDVAGNSEKNR